MIFDDNSWEDNRYYPSSPGVTSVLFTKVVRRCGGGSAGRCSENPKMATAAVRALAMPNGGGGIGNSGGREGARHRHQGRGKGGRGGWKDNGRGRWKERHGVLREGQSLWQRPHSRGDIVVCARSVGATRGVARVVWAAPLTPAQTAGGHGRNGRIPTPIINNDVGAIAPVRRRGGGEA